MGTYIEVYKTKQGFSQACAVVGSHHLYVDGWAISSILDDFLCSNNVGHQIEVMSLAYDPQTQLPVGVAIISRLQDQHRFDVYVNPDHRRKGIGSKLINTTVDKDYVNVTVGEGVEGSGEFWDSLNLFRVSSV